MCELKVFFWGFPWCSFFLSNNDGENCHNHSRSLCVCVCYRCEDWITAPSILTYQWLLTSQWAWFTPFLVRARIHLFFHLHSHQVCSVNHNRISGFPSTTERKYGPLRQLHAGGVTDKIPGILCPYINISEWNSAQVYSSALSVFISPMLDVFNGI